MYTGASQVEIVVKNPTNAEDTGDMGSIPGLGRSPGGGHGNPFQYSCLENSMDRGTWQTIVHIITKSWTRLKQLSMHTYAYVYIYMKCYSEFWRVFLCVFSLKIFWKFFILSLYR